LEDILERIVGVFDEEEKDIPEGAEDEVMESLDASAVGATKRARRPKKKASTSLDG
jgi:Mg2+/Co2+ transporter CorB